MEFKIGDRLLCKKIHKWYIKGNFYVINDVDIGPFTNDVSVEGYWFNLDKGYIGVPLFSDYFYTLEELRKLKLEKINGNS